MHATFLVLSQVFLVFVHEQLQRAKMAAVKLCQVYLLFQIFQNPNYEDRTLS